MALSKAFLLLGLFLFVSLHVASYAFQADEAEDTLHVDARHGGGCRRGCCSCCRSAEESMTLGGALYGGAGIEGHGGYNRGRHGGHGGGGYNNGGKGGHGGGGYNNGGQGGHGKGGHGGGVYNHGAGGDAYCRFGCCRCCQ